MYLVNSWNEMTCLSSEVKSQKLSKYDLVRYQDLAYFSWSLKAYGKKVLFRMNKNNQIFRRYDISWGLTAIAILDISN